MSSRDVPRPIIKVDGVATEGIILFQPIHILNLRTFLYTVLSYKLKNFSELKRDIAIGIVEKEQATRLNIGVCLLLYCYPWNIADILTSPRLPSRVCNYCE